MFFVRSGTSGTTLVNVRFSLFFDDRVAGREKKFFT